MADNSANEQLDLVLAIESRSAECPQCFLSPGKGASRTPDPGEFCPFGCIHVAIMNVRVFVVAVFVLKTFHLY